MQPPFRATLDDLWKMQAKRPISCKTTVECDTLRLRYHRVSSPLKLSKHVNWGNAMYHISMGDIRVEAPYREAGQSCTTVSALAHSTVVLLETRGSDDKNYSAVSASAHSTVVLLKTRASDDKNVFWNRKSLSQQMPAHGQTLLSHVKQSSQVELMLSSKPSLGVDRSARLT